MVTEEKIKTRHPEGKQGVNISKAKYDQIREAIVDALAEEGELKFQELGDQVEARLDHFDGSVMWYVTTVKLDLEARDVIERVPNASPQRLRLVEA